MSYPETAKWISEHYPELQEKYPDEWIAVHNNKVLAHGREFGKVRNRARKIEKEFTMKYVLSGDLFVF